MPQSAPTGVDANGMLYNVANSPTRDGKPASALSPAMIVLSALNLVANCLGLLADLTACERAS